MPEAKKTRAEIAFVTARAAIENLARFDAPKAEIIGMLGHLKNIIDEYIANLE